MKSGIKNASGLLVILIGRLGTLSVAEAKPPIDLIAKPLATITTEPSSAIQCEFAPDGKTLLSTAKVTEATEQTLTFWDIGDVENPRQRSVLTVTSFIWSVRFSPFGHTLAAGAGSGEVHLWSVATKKRQGLLEGHEKAVVALAFSPDGSQLATGSDDNRIIVWDLIKKERARTLVYDEHESNKVTSVEFSPDGNTLLAGYYENAVLWDLASGKVLVRLPTAYHVHAGFSHRGRRAYTVSAAAEAAFWDVPKGHVRHCFRGTIEPIPRIPKRLPSRVFGWGRREEILVEPIYSAALSSTGELLALGSGYGRAVLWDTHTGKALIGFTGHTDGNSRKRVMDVAFSPDDSVLATAGQEGSIMLWPIPAEMRNLGRKSGE